MARRLPAEWEPQAATLITWPHAGSDWRCCLDEIEACYEALALAIARFQPVLIAAVSEDHAHGIRRRLLGAGIAESRLHLVTAPSDDTWVRDYGPRCVLDAGRPRLLDFRFNAWGEKYPHEADDAFSGRLYASGLFAGIPHERAPWVLEGGALDTDGRGTLLANRPSILDPRRNPDLDPPGAEERLLRDLGLDRCLWLDIPPLAGDDTDGHIDTLVRFIAPDTLCHLACSDPADPDHATLEALQGQLQRLRTRHGGPYRLIALPKPAPLRGPDGDHLPASPVNFLFVNGGLLVPTYADPADARVLETLAAALPERRVVGLDGRLLARQRGGLHCAALDLPACLAAPLGLIAGTPQR